LEPIQLLTVMRWNDHQFLKGHRHGKEKKSPYQWNQ
jgi:hypothetical protein